MPLFGNQQQNQGTAVWEPQAADGGLAHTAGANPAGVFTSDLSVSEYVLLGEAGFEPLVFVVAPPSTTSACKPAAGARTRSCRSSLRPCTTPGNWLWPGCVPRPTTCPRTASSG